MSEDTSDDGRSVERRTVLRNAAATVGGLVAVSGAGGATEFDGAVRTHGDLSPTEATELLRRVDDFDGAGDADGDCYTETKCVGTACGGYGTLAERTCCPNIVGCGECCESWNYTNICC